MRTRERERERKRETEKEREREREKKRERAHHHTIFGSGIFRSHVRSAWATRAVRIMDTAVLTTEQMTTGAMPPD
jgi:hypothetical protein